MTCAAEPGQHPRLDLNWLDEDLALGGRFAEHALDCLVNEHRIRRIVDVRAEHCDDRDLLARRGVELLHLPAADLKPPGMDMLWTAVEWINADRDPDRRTLVHCEHGIGRSAVVACCVLVSRGMNLREALQHAKDAREKVSPSPQQIRAMIRWTRQCCARTGRTAPRVTWQELGAIAWRHLYPVTQAPA